MRTKLLLLLALTVCSLTFGQNSINEREGNKSSREDYDITKKKYTLNLDSYKSKVGDINIFELFSKKLNELNIKTDLNNNVKLNDSEVEKLSTVSSMVETEVELDENVIKDDLFYYEYFENKLKKSKDKINTLNASKKAIIDDEKELIKLKKEIDIEEAERKRIVKIIDDLDTKAYEDSKSKQWLPTMEVEEREIFYNNIYSKDSDRNSYLLNNVAAQIGTSTAAISSELIASYFKAVRVSFGTLMTNSNETEEEPAAGSKVDGETNTDETNAFQRLLSSGGGNLYLNLEFPLYYLQTSTTTLFLNSNAKGGVVLTQFSNDVDTSAGSGNIGLNFYGSISSDDKKSFLFFFNSNFGGYGGGTEFYSKLNLKENKIFGFGQVTLGLDIAKSIRISYTVGTFGSDDSLRSKRGVVGIQLLKGLFD